MVIETAMRDAKPLAAKRLFYLESLHGTESAIALPGMSRHSRASLERLRVLAHMQPESAVEVLRALPSLHEYAARVRARPGKGPLAQANREIMSLYGLSPAAKLSLPAGGL